MTLLSFCLAAAAAVSAQTAPVSSAPGPSLRTYEHTARQATLVVITPAGKDRPEAVYYEGPKGRWLVSGSDLYSMGSDDGWAQIRHDIYWMDKSGLSYMVDSYASPTTRLWTSPDAVTAVEEAAAKLSYGKGLQEAPLDCLARVARIGQAVGRTEGYRSGFETAAKLEPGTLLSPERLPGIKAELEGARAALASAKALCETATKDAFSGASAGKTAPLFYESARQADKAAAAAGSAQSELDGMRIPNY